MSTPPRRQIRSASMVRRLWILPLSVIIVAVIGYAVSKLQSSTYTASSSVVVTSVPGSGAQTGNAQNASILAATLTAGLPHDPTLAAYVSRAAHVPASGAITASPSSGTVVRLNFTASTSSAAIAGARALASGLTGPHPHSAIAAAGDLKLVSTPATATVTATGRYRAQAVMLVPLGGGPAEGINPDDAQHLATTYAAIMASDDALLAQVARAVGESQATVTSDLSVVNTSSTSILVISFRAGTPRQAAVGAATFAELVTGSRPVGAGIIPSSLDLVSLPPAPAAVPATGSSSAKPIAIGAIIGLLVGIVLLVAWERSDPRVDDAAELSAQLGCPATPGDRLSLEAAAALLERWRGLTDRVPARIALLPGDRAAAVDADRVIQALLDAGDESVVYFQGRDAAGMPPEYGDGRVRVVLVDAGPAEDERAGEVAALGCDLTVVIVRRGTRNTDVRQLARELGNFGVVPTWAILTRGRSSVPRSSLKDRAAVG